MEKTTNSRWNWLNAFPLVIAIPIIVILLASIIYFVVFAVTFTGNGISTDPNDWADSATFINLIVSALNLIVFVVLSLLVYRYNINKDKSTDAFQQAIEKPILVFRQEANAYRVGIATYSGWTIKNIGNGPALNLLVTYKTARAGQWEEPATKCYSIGKDEDVLLSWIGGADVTVVVYKDIFGNEFGSVLVDDQSFVENLNVPSSVDPFGLGITAQSLKGIFDQPSQRREDAVMAGSGTPKTSVTSTTTTTRKELPEK